MLKDEIENLVLDNIDDIINQEINSTKQIEKEVIITKDLPKLLKT